MTLNSCAAVDVGTPLVNVARVGAHSVFAHAGVEAGDVLLRVSRHDQLTTHSAALEALQAAVREARAATGYRVGEGRAEAEAEAAVAGAGHAGVVPGGAAGLEAVAEAEGGQFTSGGANATFTIAIAKASMLRQAAEEVERSCGPSCGYVKPSPAPVPFTLHPSSFTLHPRPHPHPHPLLHPHPFTLVPTLAPPLSYSSSSSSSS